MRDKRDFVTAISVPEILYFYPLMITAGWCSLRAYQNQNSWNGELFCIVFLLNFLITVKTTALCCAVFAYSSILIVILGYFVIPGTSIHANYTFYFIISSILLIFILTNTFWHIAFNYCHIGKNYVVHRCGNFSPFFYENAIIEVEVWNENKIKDCFVLGGTLVINILSKNSKNSHHTIYLKNVPFAYHIKKQIDKDMKSKKNTNQLSFFSEWDNNNFSN